MKEGRCAGGTLLYATNSSESKAVSGEDAMFADHVRKKNAYSFPAS